MTANETKTKVPAIYGAVASIRKDMPSLEKNGIGPQTQGSYKFLAIDDILSAVKPLEDKYGVISYLLSSQADFHYNRGTDKGDGRVPKENVQAYGVFVFRYVAVKDGSYIDHEVIAEGIDTQDKAVRKTVTQAQKIANITLYNIITGEQDPDAVDGGSSAQSADRTLNQAKAAKPSGPVARPKAPAGGSELNKVKDHIRATYLKENPKGAPAVKKTVDEVKAEGKITGEVEIYTETAKRLGVPYGTK